MDHAVVHIPHPSVLSDVIAVEFFLQPTCAGNVLAMTIWCHFRCMCSPQRDTGLECIQFVKPGAKLLLEVSLEELEAFASAREVDLLEGVDPWIQPHHTGIVLRLERWSNALSPAACVPHMDQERLAASLRRTAIDTRTATLTWPS